MLLSSELQMNYLNNLLYVGNRDTKVNFIKIISPQNDVLRFVVVRRYITQQGVLQPVVFCMNPNQKILLNKIFKKSFIFLYSWHKLKNV